MTLYLYRFVWKKTKRKNEPMISLNDLSINRYRSLIHILLHTPAFISITPNRTLQPLYQRKLLFKGNHKYARAGLGDHSRSDLSKEPKEAGAATQTAQPEHLQELDLLGEGLRGNPRPQPELSGGSRRGIFQRLVLEVVEIEETQAQGTGPSRASLPGVTASGEQSGGTGECTRIGGTGPLGYNGTRGVRSERQSAQVEKRRRRASRACLYADTLFGTFQGMFVLCDFAFVKYLL